MREDCVPVGSLNSGGNPSFPTHIEPPFNDRTSTSSSTGSPHSSSSSTYMPTIDHPAAPFPGHGIQDPGRIGSDRRQLTESPYIQELMEKGVKFFRYTDLITKKELGHVSVFFFFFFFFSFCFCLF